MEVIVAFQMSIRSFVKLANALILAVIQVSEYIGLLQLIFWNLLKGNSVPIICHSDWYNDGACDGDNNNKHCTFDGGDCCSGEDTSCDYCQGSGESCLCHENQISYCQTQAVPETTTPIG